MFNLEGLFLDKEFEPDLSNVKPKRIQFISDMAQGLPCITEKMLRGVQISNMKAEKQGCELSPYPNVSSIELDIKEELPRLYKVQPQVIPARANPVVFTDVLNLMDYAHPDSIYEKIEEAERTAQSIGRQIETLSVSVFPCEYLSEDIFSRMANPVTEDRERNVSALIDKIPTPEGCSELVTIWAENSKAFGRYWRKGFHKIYALYPEDMPTNNYETYSAYAKERYSSIEIVPIKCCSTIDLSIMDPEKFRKTHSLPASAYFMSNYLPQVYHLSQAFVGGSCQYLDEEAIMGCEYVEIPDYSFLTVSEKLNMYLRWMEKEYPEIVAEKHGGVYDPYKGLRISYSIHGCYEDKIWNSTEFEQIPGTVIRKVKEVVSNYSSTSVQKVVYSTSWKREDIEEICYSDTPVDEPTAQYLILDSVNEDVHNVSWVEPVQGQLYMPNVETWKQKPDLSGKMVINGVSYVLPTGLDCLMCQTVEGELRILDVCYSRKTFFERRSKIPEELRVPYSRHPIWGKSVVIYSSSYTTYGQFYIDREDWYKSFQARSRLQKNEHYVQEIIIPYLAYNKQLNRLVYDQELVLYGCQINFPYQKRARARYYEFYHQKAIARQMEIETCGGMKYQLLASTSTKIMTAKAYEEYISQYIERELVNQLTVEISHLFSIEANQGLEQVELQDQAPQDYAFDLDETVKLLTSREFLEMQKQKDVSRMYAYDHGSATKRFLDPQTIVVDPLGGYYSHELLCQENQQEQPGIWQYDDGGRLKFYYLGRE